MQNHSGVEGDEEAAEGDEAGWEEVYEESVVLLGVWLHIALLNVHSTKRAWRRRIMLVTMPAVV